MAIGTLVKTIAMQIVADPGDSYKVLGDLNAQAEELAKPKELVLGVDSAEAQASLDEAAAAMERYGDAQREVAAAQDELAAAQARLDEAIAGSRAESDAAVAAQDELAAAQFRVADATQGAYDAQRALARAQEEAAPFADAAAAAQDRLALATARAGDAAGVAGDKQLAAGAKSEEAADDADAASSKLSKWGGIAALAVIGVGVASVKMAVDFQRSMEMLVTEAGVPRKALGFLKTGVLNLAGAVGFSPDSLAQALYHVESTFASVGISGPKALALLKAGAQAAQIGQAPLVATQNALDAAVVAGIPGIRNYGQAAAIMLAIVGSGDMTMTDLAETMGSGAIANAKLYGQSIYQVGAAVAVLGDNNIRGVKAGTALRMTWQAMLDPIKEGLPLLQSLGLQQGQLAYTMTHHGLSAALVELRQHLIDQHIPMKDWGDYVTQIFGKRAGVGIGILLAQLPRLLSKFADLHKGVKDWGSAWQETTHTLGVELKQIWSGLEAFGIKIGEKVIPPVTKFLGWLNDHRGVVADFAKGIGIAAAALILYGAGAKIAAIGQDILDAAMDANPFGLIAIAIAAVVIGFIELYKHCKLVRDIVADVGRFFAHAWREAMVVAGEAIKWFDNGPLKFIKAEIAQFVTWWRGHSKEISQTWKVVFHDIEMTLKVLLAIWRTVWPMFRVIIDTTWRLIADIIRTTLLIIEDVIDVAMDLMTGKWSKLGPDLEKLTSDAFRGVLRIIIDLTSGFGHLLWDAGKALISGLIGGIKDAVRGLRSVIKGIAGGISHAFASVLHILSPSKVFWEHGHMIVAGLVAGIRDNAPMAVAEAARLAAAVSGAECGRHGTAGAYGVPGAGAGGAAGVLQVEWTGGNAGDEFMQWLRKNIRFKGGGGPDSVQRALGQA